MPVLKKILFLPKYAPAGASSRYRTFQFLDLFRQQGIHADAVPFFSDSYVKHLYFHEPLKKILKLPWYYLRRIDNVLRAGKYDLVFIEKELIPYFPGILEQYLYRRNIPYILDYDDAVFHHYDQSRGLGRLFAGKIPRILSKANGVIAGSPYLAEYAQRFSDNVIEIPTVIDLQKYQSPKSEFGQTPVFGWLGSPSTTHYINGLIPQISEFLTRSGSCIHLIGYDSSAWKWGQQAAIRIIPWSAEGEISEIMKLDVGLMPLDDTLWSKGKCGFKLIQYMACGLPVIASDIGVNRKLIEPGRNGFLVNTRNDWIEAMQYTMEHKGRLAEMGQEGRKKVEEKYNRDAVFPVMLAFLKNCLNRKGQVRHF